MRLWTPLLAVGVLLGAPAAVAQTSTTPQMTPANPGGSVSDATIQKAGKALKDVVTIRQRYAQQMQSGKGDQQSLAQQAQSESAQAVQARGLSVSQYNDVIELARNDPGVKQRLLNAAQASQ